MPLELELHIVPLANNHDRDAFSCEEPEVDRYLKKIAGQAMSRLQATTYVAVAPEEPNRILGFFTLVGKELEGAKIPNELTKKLKFKVSSTYSYPCVLLAQMGVAKEKKNTGLGGLLMIAIFQKSVHVAGLNGTIALVTDPSNKKLEKFYEHFNFVPLVKLPDEEETARPRYALAIHAIKESLKIMHRPDSVALVRKGTIGEVETIGDLCTELESANAETSVLRNFAEKINHDEPLSKQDAHQMLHGIDVIQHAVTRAVTDLRTFKAERERRDNEDGQSKKR